LKGPSTNFRGGLCDGTTRMTMGTEPTNNNHVRPPYIHTLGHHGAPGWRSRGQGRRRDPPQRPRPQQRGRGRRRGFPRSRWRERSTPHRGLKLVYVDIEDAQHKTNNRSVWVFFWFRIILRTQSSENGGNWTKKSSGVLKNYVQTTGGQHVRAGGTKVAESGGGGSSGGREGTKPHNP